MRDSFLLASPTSILSHLFVIQNRKVSQYEAPKRFKPPPPSGTANLYVFLTHLLLFDMHLRAFPQSKRVKDII